MKKVISLILLFMLALTSSALAGSADTVVYGRIYTSKLLKGYTINAAIQLRVDKVAGSIEVGKSANYNIYGVNLFEVPADEFQHVLPELVVFEGRVIEGTAKK